MSQLPLIKDQAVFVDLLKAFDTIDNSHKYEYYGLQGQINQWLRSYLDICNH